MIYEDICSKKEYEKDGVKKVIWLKVGTLRTTDDGKRFIEINILPNTPLYVFEPKKKEGGQSSESWLEEGK